MSASLPTEEKNHAIPLPTKTNDPASPLLGQRVAQEASRRVGPETDP